METPMESLVSQLPDVGVKSRGQVGLPRAYWLWWKLIFQHCCLSNKFLFPPPQYIDICSLRQKIQNIMRIGFCIGHLLLLKVYFMELDWPSLAWHVLATNWDIIPSTSLGVFFLLPHIKGLSK